MASRRPRVFIGSASESLEIAYALQENLNDVADIMVWNMLPVEPGSSVLDVLQRTIDSYDYGIFILTPDDNATIRGTTYGVPRDNVLLELGMFIGRHGAQKAFFVPAAELVHQPTDLSGIVHVHAFDYSRLKESPKEAASILGVVSTQIRRILPKSVADEIPLMRLLRSDTEIPAEFEAGLHGLRQTLHEAVLTWTVPHNQTHRDAWRTLRDSLFEEARFDLKIVVMIHHRQHYEEVLGLLALCGKNPRFALRYLEPSRPATPVLNYWAFDLTDFYFEPANFDRGRVQTTLALHVPEEIRVRDWFHGYFDDFWREASTEGQLATAGRVFWDGALHLGSRLPMDPLSAEEAAEMVDRYRTATDFGEWKDARLEPIAPA